MKKCKEGHYYCYQDSKCKPIPKGFRRGVGGYLRREREDEKEDSKKNGNGNGKSNGSSNGNGNGGNGSGNGNGGNGGNGGGNGSGGVGESVEIQNSDGETTAVVVDIIGPAHMRPRLNGEGVWKGTHITEAGKNLKENSVALPFFLKTINKTNALKKTLPLISTGIGALGSVLQTKNDNQDIERARASQASAETVKQNQKSENEFKTGKKVSRETLKRMNKPENQFNSYDPLTERKMTEKEKRKDDRLKKKYDKSDMKKSMQKQYGKEEGKKVYFATIRKQAMKEELDKKDKPYIKKLIKNLRKGSKTHAKQADKLEKKVKD